MTGTITIQWRGLTLGGAGSDFGVSKLENWFGLTGASFETLAAVGHGQEVTPGSQGPRFPYAEGWLRATPDTRDALIAELESYMIPRRSDDDDTEPLTILAGGRTATAKAQLVDFRPDTDVRDWESGLIGWRAQWRCPDPRKYGAQISATASLIADIAGVTLPRTMPFTMTPKPLGGQVTIVNTGNDPEGSPTVIVLTGPQLGNVGVINTTTGAVLKYGFALGISDQLRIDTEAGGAFLNGEYRPPASLGYVTADLRAAPGTNVYRALGIAEPGSPSITVLVEPASW